MTSPETFKNTLAQLRSGKLFDDLKFNRGIERESLRVDPAGTLSKRPHPEAFGSKLTHPTVTTDFSESQLELITPVSSSVDDTLKTLQTIHRYTYTGLGDELLWSSSMPCVLQGDPTIPLAQYGSSNLGKLKTTYRNGLGNRYGRSMQTICAVHYNFSFEDTFWAKLAAFEQEADTAAYRTRRYFDLMRNFRRFSWLLIYLFGASPAVCNSFVKGREHNLEPFDEGTLHLPNATSLRSGNLGYQSDAQSKLINICYNSLDSYVSKLASAVTTAYPDYTALGVRSDGLYHQVNDSILQSEAEFYSTIRAKRVPPKGTNFLQALKTDGVEYIEVRLLDVDPFEPIGISKQTLHFLDSFLMFCLIKESPVHDDALCDQVKTNLATVVYNGRDSETMLMDGGDSRTLADWGNALLTEVQLVAEQIDQADKSHQQAVKAQQAKLQDSSLTPSARILETMRSEQIPFFRFAMNQSLAHRQSLTAETLTTSEIDEFAETAATSRQQQQAIEATPQLPFDEYLANLDREYRDLLSS